MWLTRILYGHRFRSSKVPGLQWAGKYRRFRPITRFMIRNMEKRLAIEEENARHLSRPFLTPEEEFGHAKERAVEEKKQFLTNLRFKKVPPHRYMDDHFSHLRISRKWE
ncbi:large ribosomal subunit protein mL63-like [Diadema antillarum]|uniref:large ribosomal subunit protein mL63-like n=1 Tax=Diadema antillarum TaxID=105358 RepID=UPI003A88F9D0